MKLEEVFVRQGIPTVTFVEPKEFPQLFIALRTPGRGIVIEGPSGIGKTTAVTRALENLGLADNVVMLSARRKEDRRIISGLPEISEGATIIVDDFHRLPDSTKKALADYMKLVADEGRPNTKVVLIGINEAGRSLVAFAPDLGSRLEVIRFESNPDSKIVEVIAKGESALNISLNIRDEIVQSANGSFYLAQMLSHNACLYEGVTETQKKARNVEASFELVRGKTLDDLSRVFLERTEEFVRGTRFRPEGRAPYFHLLYWLATSDEWTLSMRNAIAKNPKLGPSVTQVVEKGFLKNAIARNKDISNVLHFDPESKLLTVEDPQYVYFIRNISWNKFAEDVGFVSLSFPSRYDFALSFAGSDRPIANRLFELLSEMEFSVFYDKNEQHRILAHDVEDYLRPIYMSDAQFVVAILGREYPKRIWTKFESEQFKNRFGENAVIPIWLSDAPPTMFDESSRVGGLTLDMADDLDERLREIADLLRKKIGETRAQ